MQVQKKFQSDSVHVAPLETAGMNLQCGDDSILRANVTRDMGLPCLGAVGASVMGLTLLVVGFSLCW